MLFLTRICFIRICLCMRCIWSLHNSSNLLYYLHKICYCYIFGIWRDYFYCNGYKYLLIFLRTPKFYIWKFFWTLEIYFASDRNLYQNSNQLVEFSFIVFDLSLLFSRWVVSSSSSIITSCFIVHHVRSWRLAIQRIFMFMRGTGHTHHIDVQNDYRVVYADRNKKSTVLSLVKKWLILLSYII